MPYSPRAKKVILSATDEAKRLEVPQVGTEPLALLREEVLATKILRITKSSLKSWWKKLRKNRDSTFKRWF